LHYGHPSELSLATLFNSCMPLANARRNCKIQ
jgi:hypothetical protein